MSQIVEARQLYRGSEYLTQREETLRTLDNYSAAIHLHAHQPIRRFVVDGEVLFDITGNSQIPGGWNELIFRESYVRLLKPLPQIGIAKPEAILSTALVSGHFFGGLRDWIKVNHPDDWQRIVLNQRQQSLQVVDTYFHDILPLQNEVIQDLFLDIGLAAFHQDFNTAKQDCRKGKAKAIWLPELAVNEKTAKKVAEHGIEILILGRDQIDSPYEAPIYQVVLDNGKSIFVIAYNHGFSYELAFGRVDNAQDYAQGMNAYGSATGFPPFIASDMETEGHNYDPRARRGENVLWFTNYLVNEALPEKGIDYLTRSKLIAPGRIKDSSWTCPHESYGRWSGYGNCNCDGADSQLRLEKRFLYEGLKQHLDKSVGELERFKGWQQSFIDFFLDQRQNLALGKELDYNSLPSKYRYPVKKIIIGLVGEQSDGMYTRAGYERVIPRSCNEYLNRCATY